MQRKSSKKTTKKTTTKGLTFKGVTFSGYNKPKLTPNHPTKKAVVLAKVGSEIKMIRFGAQGYGHNYSAAARKSFKARHGKNIERGKLSAAYWADRFLWGGPGKNTKNPPKGRKGKY